jgi:group I intron endonuclease
MVKQRRGCIYKLTNTLNGKYYFGQTIDFKRRMANHKSSLKKNTYLSNAIRKYGWDNFQQEILIDNVPEEDLNQLEISYIEIHDSTNRKKGYNLTVGGEGTRGYTHTDEAKKKILTAKKNHSVEKGCISFSKKSKKWKVISSRGDINFPEKYIGLYNTKEKAIQALDLYNTTGGIMQSDITKRKKNTGSVCFDKTNKKWRVAKGRKGYIGLYNTKERALHALEIYNNSGKRMQSDVRNRRNGTGSISFDKRCKTWRATVPAINGKKRHRIGSFKTKELAEEALKQYIKNIN